MTATLEPNDFTLKAALRELLDKFDGGAMGAEKHCRLKHAQLSNCASNASSQMLPLDVAWRLERKVDFYPVTTALAAIAERVLTPRAAANGPATGDLMTLLLRIGAESGDVARAFSEGVADGSLDAADLARAERELHEAAAAISKGIEWVSAEKLRRQGGGA